MIYLIIIIISIVSLSEKWTQAVSHTARQKLLGMSSISFCLAEEPHLTCTHFGHF